MGKLRNILWIAPFALLALGADPNDPGPNCMIDGGDPIEAGPLDEIGIKPVHRNPLIQEPRNAPTHGGLILGHFRSPRAATVDAVRLNGKLPDRRTRYIQYCDIPKPALGAGEIGIVRCYTEEAEFDPGKPLLMEVLSGGEVLWRREGTIPAPTLTPSYIAASVAEDEILVHVRNDAAAPWTVTGLRVDGADVTREAAIEGAAVPPRGLALIRYPRPEGIPYGEWTAFSVRGVGPGGATAEVTRSMRLFRPHFPMGDWTEDNGGDPDLWNDESEVRKYLNVGVDMFMYSPNPGAPPEYVIGNLAEKYDFTVFLHSDHPPTQFIAEWADHPRVMGAAVAGEPGGGTPWEEVADVVQHRELWGATKPNWIYEACAYNFAKIGPIADIGGTDHYAMIAPKCNTLNPPFIWGDRIEFVGYYGDEAKYAAEPQPAWNWVQGLYVNGFPLRCTNAGEIRSQFIQKAGHGSKALLWFQAKPSFQKRCAQETLDEMARLKRELDQYKEYLLEGELAPRGTVATTAAPKMEVSATVGPRGMVVALTDLDYEIPAGDPVIWLTPLLWPGPRTNVAVDLAPPDYFVPGSAALVVGDDQVPLTLANPAPGRWRFTVPELSVAGAVLVLPAS